MKAVFSDIAKAIRWSVSLGNKFLRVVPGLTFLAVICSVFSQFFLLVGFLLPLKVVLLLGSDSVPGYFPPILHGFGRDGLVLFLSLASVAFYLLHLLLEKLVDLVSASASSRLLARSRKMAIFENQNEIATKGYQRYSQSLAAVTFVSICLVVMAFFYSELAVLIFLYLMMCFAVVGFLSAVFQTFADRLHRDLSSIAKILGSVGFLVMFAFIVADHLFGSAPGILVSVVSLLLGRQAFGRMTNLVKGVQGLYNQRAQLAALFFHGHIFLRRSKGREKGIWELVEPELRDEWLRSLLRSVLGYEPHPPEFTVRWFDLGLPDVLCYEVSVAEGRERRFLVKVFNSNRSAWAKHEATIIAGQADLPTVPCVALTMVQGLHCHIFETTGLVQCGKSETSRKIHSFRLKLSACQPSEEMTSLFLRSHPQVWQRLESHSIRRTEYLLDGKADRNLIDRLLKVFPEIKVTLKELPPAICAPDIRVGMLWRDVDGNCLLAHWAVWNIEPLGTKWPFVENKGCEDAKYRETVRERRSDVAYLDSQRMRLAAIFSELESRLARGRYLEAYSLFSPLLTEYEQV